MMKDFRENAMESAKNAAHDMEHEFKKCTKCMKKNIVELNIKCSEYDLAMFFLGATALIATVHIVMRWRNKSKIKKEILYKTAKTAEKEAN